MNNIDVVFEGPDNTGKSTLIKRLHGIVPYYTVRSSEGPEKYPGEIDKRIKGYLESSEIIYDRHPAVSEAIFGPIIRKTTGPSESVKEAFYRTKPIFIYCRAVEGRGLEDHVIKENSIDTPDHLSGVYKHYDEICRQYDEWALQNANYVYRIGDDVNRLLNSLGGMLQL